MTNRPLHHAILIRLYKLKILLLLSGVLFAFLMFFYSKKLPVLYTTKATVYPLSSSSENSATANTLSTLLGISDLPKSFVAEASISIVDVASSKSTREAVVLEKIPSLGNKTIAELLIEDYNKYKSFNQKTIEMPKEEKKLSAVGGKLLFETMKARMTKSGILEIILSSHNPSILTPVANTLVERISFFYKNLKIKKAKIDYDFATSKVDSFGGVLSGIDGQAIGMANHTMFVLPDNLQYQLPKENNAIEKSRVLRQRDVASDTKEEALWRLQKVTPVIDILDQPEPPFDEQKPPVILYTVFGFFAGMLLFSIFAVTDLWISNIRYKMKMLMEAPKE